MRAQCTLLLLKARGIVLCIQSDDASCPVSAVGNAHIGIETGRHQLNLVRAHTDLLGPLPCTRLLVVSLPERQLKTAAARDAGHYAPFSDE